LSYLVVTKTVVGHPALFTGVQSGKNTILYLHVKELRGKKQHVYMKHYRNGNTTYVANVIKLV
jgi:hypothetical protein